MFLLRGVLAATYCFEAFAIWRPKKPKTWSPKSQTPARHPHCAKAITITFIREAIVDIVVRRLVAAHNHDEGTE